MDLLYNFHFIRPLWLLLIPLAVLLWWLWQQRSSALRGWQEQMDPELLRVLVVGQKPVNHRFAAWILVAWILTTIAVAGPTWRLEPNPFVGDAQPLMILLKADTSMLQPNLSPTRLERAQLKIADLAKLRKGQPLGLIAYAGSAHLVLPPTRDTEIVAEMAAELSPEIMPVQGDRVDLALQKAAKILKDQDSGGTVLVIADSATIDPNQLQKNLPAEMRLPVQFLALADPDSSETQSLRDAAKPLRATVQNISIDDEDITAITNLAERTAATSIVGESSRWQEAGYWLTPLLALIVAFSFRREKRITTEKNS
ncbi:TPR domain protein in aerotolerance operon [Planctomycetales bacterium 10988]|nr:TPR domain protein in aerotolerance operon [Planctomycetales bacterium 10988]